MLKLKTAQSVVSYHTFLCSCLLSLETLNQDVLSAQSLGVVSMLTDHRQLRERAHFCMQFFNVFLIQFYIVLVFVALVCYPWTKPLLLTSTIAIIN